VIFRILLEVIIVLFFVVRVVNHRRAIQQGGHITYKEQNAGAIALMRKVGGVLFLASLVAYLTGLRIVDVASVPFPDWLRWVGIGIGFVSVTFIWWTEFSLGLNFNTTLHVREGHTLVTHGPYRWIRHPMYTGLYLFAASLLFISANAFVGLPGVLSLTVILLNRVKHEEETMLQLFGEEYGEYMRRTGRFLPSI